VLQLNKKESNNVSSRSNLFILVFCGLYKSVLWFSGIPPACDVNVQYPKQESPAVARERSTVIA